MGEDFELGFVCFEGQVNSYVAPAAAIYAESGHTEEHTIDGHLALGETTW